MLTSKEKGILTELQCITAFASLGYHISIPYGENSRYDFIADIEGNLIKVQVKTSRAVDELAITFSCRSTRVNTQGNLQRSYNKKEIDYFCTYWDNQCYLVPVEECSSYKTLRFACGASKQTRGINFAKDYTLETQIKKILGGVKE